MCDGELEGEWVEKWKVCGVMCKSCGVESEDDVFVHHDSLY